jgi:hypothetical protein
MDASQFADAPSEAEDVLDDYLDRVCAPLVGRVRYGERQAFRSTVRSRVEALLAASPSCASEADALKAALALLGPADRVSREALQNQGAASRAPCARRLTDLFAGAFVAGIAGLYVSRWTILLTSAIHQTRFISGPVSDGLGVITAELVAVVVWRLRFGPAKGALAGFAAHMATIVAYCIYAMLTFLRASPIPVTWGSVLACLPSWVESSVGSVLIGAVAGAVCKRRPCSRRPPLPRDP